MNVLVVYASRYGATEEIARRIAEKIQSAGHAVDVRPIQAAGDLGSYDALVVGSALYFGGWMKQATAFVRQNRGALASKPLWLFSSGPIGDKKTDDQGTDIRIATEPQELPELKETLHPREHRVFFGSLVPSRLGLRDRLIRLLPAGRQMLPEGDFRDWGEIEAWATNIGRALAQAPEGPHAGGTTA